MAFTKEEPIKLFIGQVPHDMEEEQLQQLLETYGPIKDLSIIRDKKTGAHRGCAFVTFASRESNELAINELHNKFIFKNAQNPIQVREAETTSERESKLFIGMLPKTVDYSSLSSIFSQFGQIVEVHILKNHDGSGKGCAFLKYREKESAEIAIQNLNGKYAMEGSNRPLVVKFAENKRSLRPVSQSVPEQPLRHAFHVVSNNSIYSHSPFTNQGTVPYQQSFLSSPLVPISYLFGTDSQPVVYVPIVDQQQNSYPLQNLGQFQYFPQITHVPNHRQVSGLVEAVQIEGVDHKDSFSQNNRTYERQKEGPSGANLFVYHLPHDLTDADLATAFSPFGTVISAKVFIDKQTNESKGFGFVSYQRPEEAAHAIQVMNGFQIGSKRLKVQHKRLTHLENNDNYDFSHSSSSSLSPLLIPAKTNVQRYQPHQLNFIDQSQSQQQLEINGHDMHYNSQSIPSSGDDLVSIENQFKKMNLSI